MSRCSKKHYSMNKLESLEYLVDNFIPPYTDEWMLAGLSDVLCDVIKSSSSVFEKEELNKLLEKAYKN
jgi:hypothetical protein